MKANLLILGKRPELLPHIFCLVTLLLLIGQPVRLFAEPLADCEMIEGQYHFSVDVLDEVFRHNYPRKISLQKPSTDKASAEAGNAKLKELLKVSERHDYIADILTAFTGQYKPELKFVNPELIRLNTNSLEVREKVSLKTDAAQPPKKVRFKDFPDSNDESEEAEPAVKCLYRILVDLSDSEDITLIIRLGDELTTYLICRAPFILSQSSSLVGLSLQAQLQLLTLSNPDGACGQEF